MAFIQYESSFRRTNSTSVRLAQDSDRPPPHLLFFLMEGQHYNLNPQMSNLNRSNLHVVHYLQFHQHSIRLRLWERKALPRDSNWPVLPFKESIVYSHANHSSYAAENNISHHKPQTMKTPQDSLLILPFASYTRSALSLSLSSF